MYVVREAGIEDFSLLAELGRRAFYEAFGAYNDPADMQAYLDLAFNPETIQNQLKDADTIYLIASHNQDPVGYSKLRRNSGFPELEGRKVIQLERIYALQEYVGKKVGKVLMEACIKIAKSEKFEFVWLSVWQENKRAIEFYKRWGFKIIGFKQFKIGKEINDDFVMALNLTEKV